MTMYPTMGGAINKDSKYIREICRMVDANYSQDMIVTPAQLHVTKSWHLRCDWHYLNDEKTTFD